MYITSFGVASNGMLQCFVWIRPIGNSVKEYHERLLFLCEIPSSSSTSMASSFSRFAFTVDALVRGGLTQALSFESSPPVRRTLF